MRTAIKIFLLTLAVAIVALIAVVLGGSLHSNEFTMPGGSAFRVEKVAFGKFEHFQPGGMLEKLKQKLPNAWQKGFFRPFFSNGNSRGGINSWWGNTTVHTNDDALYIYCTLRNPNTGAYQNTAQESVTIVDEHGCVFLPTQAGGESSGNLAVMTARGPGYLTSGYAVGWYRFEAFPRRERKFRLRIRRGTNAPAELVVRNPAPPPKAKNWVVEALPVTKKDGDVTFILADLKIHDPPRLGLNGIGARPSIPPKYEVIEGGQPSENWQVQDTELYDSSGNFTGGMTTQARCLCPWEAAWKLRVRFFASEQSHAASNTTWTLHGVKVPDAGKFISLNDSRELDGVMVKAITFAGPGRFVYLNDDTSESSPLTNSLEKSSVEVDNTSYLGSSVEHVTVEGKTPHLLADLGELTDDQRLTLRATDERGREYYAWEWNQWGGNEPPKNQKVNYLVAKRYGRHRAFLSLDLPPDVKTVDLTFCVHTCRTEEFIFKPPTPEKRQGK